MALNGKSGWMLRLGVGILLVAVAYWQFQSRQEAAANAEKARLVATVTTASLICRDASKPFEVTIRNLTGRTVMAASFTFHEALPPPGLMPSDHPVVRLKEPLRSGEARTSCEALNRYRLIARGVDPARVHFIPMLADIAFQ